MTRVRAEHDERRWCISIGEPRSERVQTDLDEKVTGEWNEQEVAVQSLGSLIVPV